MRNPTPDLSVLTLRNCLVTFAAMALSCDNRVTDHEMGYNVSGGGIAYITAKGITRRTGLDHDTAEQALHRLQAAGVAEPNSDGTAWRTDPGILTPHDR